MSVRDTRGWSDDPKRHDRGGRSHLADLSDRLVEARRRGDPAPEELERLVSLLAQSDYEPGERLTQALEGLARWSGGETAGRPAPARRQPVPAELEARLVDFAASLADRTKPYSTSPAAHAAATPAPRRPDPRTPPIASLRAALAEISERQKALDSEERQASQERQASHERQAPRRVPTREPEARPEPRRPEPAPARPAAAAPLAAIEPRRTYAPQQKAADPASGAMIRELRAEIDRLGRSVSDLPTRNEVDTLAREMGQLAGRITIDRPARLDPASLGAIDALVGEVDRMRRDAASPQMIADLAEELHAISSRLDAVGPSNSAAIDALARRVEDLRAELAQFPRASSVDVLASEIQAVIARLDEQERAAAPTRQAVAGLTVRVEAIDGRMAHMAEAAAARDEAFERANHSIRAELDTLPRAAAVSDLGRQLDSLTDSLKNRSAIGPALKAVEGLTTRVEALDGKLEAIARVRADETEWLAETMRGEIAAAARPEAFDSIERQIAALVTRMPTGRDEHVAGEMQALSSKVDGLGDRLRSIAKANGAREATFDRIEQTVRAIADQLVEQRSVEPVERTDGGALDAEITRLVDGLERNDGRLDDLNAAFAGLAARIERSCADLGTRYEETRGRTNEAPRQDERTAEEISRALGELRASAAQNERRAADALDAVRSTLERLLDRMEQIETAPARAAPPFGAPVEETRYDAPRAAEPESRPDAAEAARAAARRALAEIAAGDEPPAARMPRVEEPRFDEPRFAPYQDLADDPIEPGAGAPNAGAAAAPSAASFIASARRASAPPAAEPEASEDAPLGEPAPSGLSAAIAKLKSQKRPFLLGLAATLIVLAALYVANGMTGEPAEPAPEPAPQSRLAPDLVPAPAARPSAMIENPRVPTEAPAVDLAEKEPPAVTAGPSASAPKPEAAAPRAPARDAGAFAFSDAASLPKSRTVEWKAGEPVTTGSIARTAPGGMPDAIGGPTLRVRAAAGDPSAQLEVADRLLEGRNVEPDAASAAVWLEKAAAQGLAPAQHRLGSLYEKGRGVARDVQAARRWYEQAAAAGNVRAMHNLGVVYAEGGLGKPDYDAASVWFRMAAERGLVDSQYNLAVLDARGVAGKRDLPAAYKWFALAAAQGDEDAAKKREEVGKALGAQLAGAKASVESFRPRSVEAAANEVPSPPGGWDRVAERRDASTPR